MGERERTLSLLGRALAAALLLLAAALPAPCAAGGEITEASIRAKWTLLAPAGSAVPFDEAPCVSAPHRCGKLRPDFLRDGLNLLNFARYVAGLPDDVALDPDLTEKAQHGAVVMAALRQMTHFPGRPADMEEQFFTIGAASTSSSNIDQGSRSLAVAMIHWLSDGSSPENIRRVGHRRWVLNPALQKTGFGYARAADNGPPFAAMQAFDHSRADVPDYDAVLWPARGPFPTDLLAGADPWSISLNPAHYRIPQIDRVRVTLRRRGDGQTWSFSKADNALEPGRPYLNVNAEGYGTPGCIIFRPHLIFAYHAGEEYEVEVTGLQDVQGADTSLRYSVRFFDLSPRLAETLPLQCSYRGSYRAYNDGTVELTWSVSVTAGKVGRFRLTRDGAPLPELPGDTTRCRITGFAPGKAHVVTLQAGDNKGNWSEPALEIKVNVPGR